MASIRRIRAQQTVEEPELPNQSLEEIENWVQELSKLNNPNISQVRLLLQEWVRETINTQYALDQMERLVPRELHQSLTRIIQNAEEVMSSMSDSPEISRDTISALISADAKLGILERQLPSDTFEIKDIPPSSSQSSGSMDEASTKDRKAKQTKAQTYPDFPIYALHASKRRKLDALAYALVEESIEPTRDHNVAAHSDTDSETEKKKIPISRHVESQNSIEEDDEAASTSSRSSSAGSGKRRSPPRRRTSKRSKPKAYPLIAGIVPARRAHNQWSKEESDKLIELKTNYPDADWKWISTQIGSSKSSTQCGTNSLKSPRARLSDAVLIDKRRRDRSKFGFFAAQRWARVLDPELSKDPLTADEEEQLLLLQEEHGNRWAHIAKSFEKRRSDVTLRVHALKMQGSMRKSWSKSEDEHLMKIMETQLNRDPIEVDWVQISSTLSALRVQRFPLECRSRYKVLQL